MQKDVRNEERIGNTKKGNCKCSKLAKTIKQMNIDKTKDGTNLATDVLNINFKWGRDVSASSQKNETQETVKQMMKNSI